MRKCIGCMQSRPQDELIRMTLTKDKDIVVDNGSRSDGRGCYACRNAQCVESIRKKRRLNRAFRTDLDEKVIDRTLEKLLETVQGGNECQ